MSILSTISTPLTRDGGGDLPVPPWVADVYGLRHEEAETAGADVLSLRVAMGDGAALVTARIREALAADAPSLQRQVAAAYAAIRARLLRANARHAVRFWNYIPAINDRMPDGRDRYMVFNAGRFEAFSKWYGGPERFDRHVPTASGVGHAGRGLVIHCLAAHRAGTARANPRQGEPFHYSQRFRPLPPPFARAPGRPFPPPLLRARDGRAFPAPTRARRGDGEHPRGGFETCAGLQRTDGGDAGEPRGDDPRRRREVRTAARGGPLVSAALSPLADLPSRRQP